MTSRRPSAPWRGHAILAGGLGAACALVVASALAADPDVLASATVARASAQVAGGISAAWDRLAVAGALLAAPSRGARVLLGPDPIEWSEPLAPPPPARDLSEAARTPPRTAFDLLLAESLRVEREGDLDEARALCDEALALPHDAPRAAEGRLIALRLAAAAKDSEATLAAFRALDAAVLGLDARGDVAYTLLGALCALPALDDALRAPVLARVFDLWSADALALPEGAAGLDAPLRAALLRELERYGPLPDGVLAAEERRRARALVARVEAAGLALAEAPTALQALDLGEHVLLHRVEATPADAASAPREPNLVLHRARVLPRAIVEAALLAEAGDAIPEGFVVDFGSDPAGAAAALAEVHPRTSLAGGALAFRLRHADPDALARSETTRATVLRGGLVATALLLAGGTMLVWRLIERERRLIALRATFVAGVSHELRTPLASILLMSENLLERRVPAASLPRYFALIRREALRLARLVDDVLDVSRLERGEPARLLLEDQDVQAFLAALEADARERCAAAGGALAFRSGPAPATLHADGEALRRAALNLVDNAMKHSGSLEVEVDARAQDGELVIAVRDRGRGVPADRRAQVFEPFERLDAGPDAPPGAGLGLAIVAEIAAAHGGRALARAPEDGPGAVFELRVPLDGDPPGDAARADGGAA